jgi:hypothetical protein
MLSVALELPWRCPRCQQPLPLNGATVSVLCDACRTVVDTPPAFWREVVGEAVGYARRFADGATQTMTVMGKWGAFSLHYGRLPPRCTCAAAFVMDDVVRAAQTGAPLGCGACGATFPTRPAPDWLKEAVHAGLVAVAGERLVSERAQAADASAVRFHCYHCAAAVPLDGSSRMVKCHYCATDLAIPDAVWVRLHPTPTTSRWYLLLE